MMIRTLEQLRSEVRDREVFPDFVIDEIETTVAGESMRDWFCWHRAEDPGATQGPAGRQVVVFGLTDTRFVYLNSDDAPYRQQPCWSTSVTAVPLRSVASVIARSRRIAPDKEQIAGKLPDVAYLVVSWNSDKKLKAGMYGYEAYSANVTANDASIRVSVKRDGEDSVKRLREFGAVLGDAVARAE